MNKQLIKNESAFSLTILKRQLQEQDILHNAKGSNTLAVYKNLLWFSIGYSGLLFIAAFVFLS